MTEIAAAIEVSTAMWRASEELGLTDKIRDLFRKTETLLVLGPSGSGKTNLIASLNSASGWTDPIARENRTASTVRAKVRVNDEPFVVIDTPGQELHESDRLRTIREVAANPPVRVLNVVSYGYHEYETALSNAIDSDGLPREEFLDAHRQEELRALTQWLPILGDRAITKWVLTVVTKADLWWHERDTVLRSYTHGEYSQAIRDWDSNLHHVVLPYCSVAHRFYDVAPFDGSFDDRVRIDTNIYFLKQLVDLD